MTELPLITVSADGLQRGGSSWTPPGPWVGALETAGGDRRGALLQVAAQARKSPLAVVRLAADADDHELVLAQLAAEPPDRRPRGLLLGERWQEAAAGRCPTLTGAAADLGLADAVRDDGDGRWQGHHLLAGALEAFLAQTWPESAGPVPRAVILGDGATAVTAALVAARRGAASVTLVVEDPQRRAELVARLSHAVDWPSAATWQVSAGLEPDVSPAGLWLRATAAPVAAAVWLPDAAGDRPCLLADLLGATTTPPLGFVHPTAGGVQVMAAGLAAAWYLGPPIPWEALTEEPPA